MEFYTTYSKEEISKAASEGLKIVSDYDYNLGCHLTNIKKKILIDDNTLISIIAAINAGFNVILYC